MKPKFCVGEEVRVQGHFSEDTERAEVLSKRFFDDKEFWVGGNPEKIYKPVKGWWYALDHIKGYMIPEKFLRKLPPNPENSFENIMAKLKKGVVSESR